MHVLDSCALKLKAVLFFPYGVEVLGISSVVRVTPNLTQLTHAKKSFRNLISDHWKAG